VLKSFATVDPENLTSNTKAFNLISGNWEGGEKYMDLVDPLKGGVMCKIPDTESSDSTVDTLI
jgi:hypothetical protein